MSIESQLLPPLDRLHRALHAVIGAVAGALLALMMLQITLDVAMRELAGFQIPGTVEAVSNYYMVAVTFLCISFAQLGGDHIEMALLMSSRSPAVQKAAFVLATLLTMAVYAFLTYVSAIDAAHKTAVRTYTTIGSYPLSTWPAYWLLPLGFAAMVLVALTTGITRFLREQRPEAAGSQTSE